MSPLATHDPDPASLRKVLWLTLLLGCLAPCARAARFGVPVQGFDPRGYFILSGPQVPTGGTNNSWGDKRHALDLYVEVTGTTLRVDIYDPGLVSATAPNLDLYFNGTVGQVTYTLHDPGASIVVRTSYRSDTEGPGGTNLALVTLYDGPARPGVYRLAVTMDDTATADEDVNSFGISVPGYDMYSYHFTGGELNAAGARILEPVAVYPYVVHSNLATFGGNPVVGVDVMNFDFDAPSTMGPPYLRLETPSRRGADLNVSGDNALYTTNLRGIDVSSFDCSDYGIYTLGALSLSAVKEGTVDAQVVSAQVVNYGAGVSTAAFPVAAGAPEAPARLYYPRDDMSPPVKERFVHTARIVAGANPATVGGASVIEVTVALSNLTAYEVTDVDARSALAPDPDFSDPVVVRQDGGLVGTTVGRDIFVAGRVAPRSSGSVVYRTTFTPAAAGTRYLTGDGTDFLGGARPTLARYATPFAQPPDLERFGPICMLKAEAVDPSCVATAAIQGDLDICAGRSTDLSAAPSTVGNCPGGVKEYRWLEGGLEIYPYPGPEVITVSPPSDALYEVKVRCSTLASCEVGAAARVTVRPRTPPPPVGNTLHAVKQDPDVRLQWTRSGAPVYNVRRFGTKRLDRPTSTLLVTTAADAHLAPGEIARTPPRYYQVLAVSDCDDEESFASTGVAQRRAPGAAPPPAEATGQARLE